MAFPKAQSAIEYLMTYGWAILIIVVVLAILFLSNVFNGSIFISNSCASSQGFVCGSPVLNQSGYLSVTVSRYGQALNVTGLACVGNTSTPSAFIPIPMTELKESYTYTLIFRCTLPKSTIGSGFTGYIWMQYSEAGQSGLVSEIGRVSTSVETGAILTTSTTSTSTSTSTTSTSTTSTSTTTISSIYCVGGVYGGNNANLVYSAQASGGTIGSWSSQTSYPTDIQSQSCDISNGYIYCVGGYNNTNGYYSTNAVYSAPASSGTIGGWSTQINYPTQIDVHSCVISNNYIYCIGGLDANGHLTNIIASAKISSGTIGSWSFQANYSTPTGYLSCAASGGYVYCIGGETNSGTSSAVYSAPISGGTIGSWSSQTSYPTVIMETSCTASNGYLYCIGGYNNSGTTSTTFSAPISVGTVGSWTGQTGYTTVVRDQSCSLSNDYLYCVGGFTNSGLTSAVYSTSASGGALGSWSSQTSYPNTILVPSCITD